jgi:hypothetical protein
MYLRVVEGPYDFWVAVTPLEVSAGDHVLMGRGPERRQFLSPALKRRFKVMTFIEHIAVVTEAQSLRAIRISQPEGAIAIADLFAQRHRLDGARVRVRGRVVKVNSGIFDRNWVHLVDGSGQTGTDDLTVTTTEEVKVGQLVDAHGTLTADKDLGFGYRYDALLEDAAVTVVR